MDGIRSEGADVPPLPFTDHFAAQPQAQPLLGHSGPQVQMMQVQFALPQLALVCSTGFIGVFMSLFVLVVRRRKSPRTWCGACYILWEKVYIEVYHRPLRWMHRFRSPA